MKTEDFDDAIKRKLESIDPTVNETDIERVYQYTVRNRGPLSMLRSNRFLWAFLGLGMLITGLVTWKLTSMYEHGQQIVSPAASGQVIPVEPKNNTTKTITKMITKTDTQYITKYVSKYPDAYTTNNKSKRNILSNRIVTKAQGPKHTYLADQSPAPTNTNEDVIKGNNLSNNSIIYNKQQVTNNVAGNRQDNNANNTSPQQNNNTIHTNNPATNPANALTEAKVIKKDSANNVAKKSPIHDYSDEHKQTAVKAPLRLNFMAGLGAEGANTQMGGGVFARLMLGRFSLNTGVKLMDINNDKYATDQDFDDSKGYNFDKAFGVPTYCSASNIQMDYFLWQVPVAIEYDQPLKNNTYFTFSVGTDLDINCTANVDFTELDYSGADYANPAVKHSYKPVIFNNIVISPGFMKQFGRFAVQVGGFASPQLEQAKYKGYDSFFYGGNLKVFYCF